MIFGPTLAAHPEGEQVTRYWGYYNEVLDTNYRDFLLIGRDTRDIYLNEVALWRNIPANVWNYHIGGYQVIKKWLSYREKKVLGCSMKMEEIEYVTEMARRLAAITVLQPALKENYRIVKPNTYPWPAS